MSEKQITVDNQKDLFKKIEDNIKIFLSVYYDNLEASINSWFGLDINKAKSTLIIDVTFNGDVIKGKQPMITKETKPDISLLSNFLGGISEKEGENSED